jgi:stage V sporulation protein B
LGAGVIVKLILNLVLVPIPQIGVNGAAWASVACHLVAFTIAITSLKRTIKPKLVFSKFVIKPIIATFIMGVCSYYIYILLSGIIVEKLATIVAIIAAVIIYILAIFALKVFSKEEILTLPMGNKICKVLEKLKIY